MPETNKQIGQTTLCSTFEITGCVHLWERELRVLGKEEEIYWWRAAGQVLVIYNICQKHYFCLLCISSKQLTLLNFSWTFDSRSKRAVEKVVDDTTMSLSRWARSLTEITSLQILLFITQFFQVPPLQGDYCAGLWWRVDKSLRLRPDNYSYTSRWKL